MWCISLVALCVSMRFSTLLSSLSLSFCYLVHEMHNCIWKIFPQRYFSHQTNFPISLSLTGKLAEKLHYRFLRHQSTENRFNSMRFLAGHITPSKRKRKRTVRWCIGVSVGMTVQWQSSTPTQVYEPESHVIARLSPMQHRSTLLGGVSTVLEIFDSSPLVNAHNGATTATCKYWSMCCNLIIRTSFLMLFYFDSS